MQAVRRMRIWSAEGYVALDFSARNGTLVRPSDRLRRGELDLEGLDITQPAAVKAHLFGKVFRVDQVRPEGHDPLARELEDFVGAVRTGARPRVSGEDGLRALRVADQVVRSLESHAWEGRPDGPIGPRHLPEPMPEPIAGLPAPKSWRPRPTRTESRPPSA
jgi:hypothetical protein